MDTLEDFLASDGDDSSISAVADHAVGFACSGLPVGEEAAVVAEPGIVKDFLADGIVDISLVGVAVIDRAGVATFVVPKVVVRPKGIVEIEVLIL